MLASFLRPFMCHTPSSYSAPDPVMAEYITIMVINNKTGGEQNLDPPARHVPNHRAAQITSELEDCTFSLLVLLTKLTLTILQ